MIEKLEHYINYVENVDNTMRKVNEVIDWINDVSALRVTDKQVTANLPNIDAGELAFLSKENSELKDELDRTRKALDVAVDALKEYADEDNWSMGFAPWAEDGTRDALYTEDGYITAENALEQITALEQKDVK